jgi:hypothetical protein
VNGFNQHQAARKTDNGWVTDVGLVAAHGHAFEPLELANGLFDACPEFVKALWKESSPLLGVFATGDYRRDATCVRRSAVRVAVISFVRHRDARADVWPDVERRLELGAVTDLTAGEVEVERVAVEIGLEVDLGREAAAWAAECLVLLPPFAPAAETWARTTVLSKNCMRCAVSLYSASIWKNASNTPDRLSRQNRFHTVFHLPYSRGSARQVMLWTVK